MSEKLASPMNSHQSLKTSWQQSIDKAIALAEMRARRSRNFMAILSGLQTALAFEIAQRESYRHRAMLIRRRYRAAIEA